MGQGLSCGQPSIEPDFFAAVQFGDLKLVKSILRIEPGIIRKTTPYGRLSSLHIAAANGHEELLSMLLERWNHPDALNRHKQTPLMLAAMRGRINCVEKLIQAGANILMFDSVNGRTCLHYAAYYGHSDCLQAVLQAAHSNLISESWGFARFVNVKDGKGATPLHLAAKQGRPSCVRMLLDKGALVCAYTGDYGCPGSTPLHLAARGGCLESVRELLAWGADRLQMDSAGRIPYVIALKRKHLCAALLNPSAAEPLVWPSPLKFISELKPDVKLLLETALIEANKKREDKIFKGIVFALPSPEQSVIDDDKSEGSGVELCCICFEQPCTIEVQDCGHQMCAHCTLALCCHNKPNPTTQCPPAPLCPFCRSNIARLAATKSEINEDIDKDISPKLRRSRFMSLSEGSSSFRGLSSAMGSFGRMSNRGSGRIVDGGDMIDKF
ncbi:E3 ubiquitin-protein ligase XB3-like [Phalaenopsis equestris]|uniref:E3 ubiquitin-protein ligase XB3-like n=1 Tax=Phalaenopsis equestris TaxID=78828 RepID=UPI0009E1EAC1|nr:E3 ubiquitin-protein ligase XB3-like [Phalaenopsis equestris]